MADQGPPAPRRRKAPPTRGRGPVEGRPEPSGRADAVANASAGAARSSLGGFLAGLLGRGGASQEGEPASDSEGPPHKRRHLDPPPPPAATAAAPTGPPPPLALPTDLKLWPFGSPLPLQLAKGAPALPAAGAFLRVVPPASSPPPEKPGLVALALADDADAAVVAFLAVPGDAAATALTTFSAAPRGRGGRAAGAALPNLALHGRGATLCIALTETAFGDELPAGGDPAAFDRRPSPWARAVRALLPWLAPGAAAADDAAEPLGDGDAAGARPPRCAFDAAALFAAIRPPPDSPGLPAPPAGLLPTLRPYQSRAVAWMLARERGEGGGGGGSSAAPPALHPLWAPVPGPPPPETDDGPPPRRGRKGKAKEERPPPPPPPPPPSFFVNPFNGRLARSPPPPPPPLAGGVLADEMGLGKTVETAALLLAGRPPPRALAASRVRREARPRADRVECVCGADSEGGAPPGTVWVQCDACDGWSHARCVGWSAAAARRQGAAAARAGRRTSPGQGDGGGGATPPPPPPSAPGFVCAGCTAARAAERVVGGPTRATIIVCPPHILRQWASELATHTAPGALRVIVYAGQGGAAATAAAGAPAPTAGHKRGRDGEAPPPSNDAVAAAAAAAGARSTRAAPVVGAADLAAADVVLTTYEVLRRDVHRVREDDGEATSSSSDEDDGEEGGGGGGGGGGGRRARVRGRSAGAPRALRHAKRYAALPSPLLRLTWWRLVLDEAQEVEGGASAAARLAVRLSRRAVHRWAVTGTPISAGGLDDLAGLASFLGAAPYDAPAWWARALADPYSTGGPAGTARLLSTLSPAAGGWLWRTAKADVPPAELGIPPQSEVTRTLALSRVEAHFYGLQHADAAAKVRAALPRADWDAAVAAIAAEAAGDGGGGGGGNGASQPAPHSSAVVVEEDGSASASDEDDDSPDPDRTLTRTEEKRILAPLLALRQAACHPQVGSHGLRPVGRRVGRAARGAGGGEGGGGPAAPALDARAPMTMDQVLSALISKARTEAEDAQRLLLAALNGGAGARLLTGDLAGAAATYRAALTAAATNSPYVRVDPLQRLHTLANLNALLDRAGRAGGEATGIPRLLSESGPVACVGTPDERGDLAARAAEIRETYLVPFRVRLTAAEAEFDHAAEEAGLKAMVPSDGGGGSRQKKKKKQRGGGPADGEGGAASDDEADVEQGGGWYLDAIDAIIARTATGSSAIAAAAAGDALADKVRGELEGADAYRTGRNATSLVVRLGPSGGGPALKPLLHGELARAAGARRKALAALADLRSQAAAPDPSLVSAAGACGRCRGGELGSAGRVCPHCRLDEAFLEWEMTLFALTTRALDVRAGGGRGGGGGGGGPGVSVEDALRAAHAAALQRVGRGGLGEEGGPEGGGAAAAGEALDVLPARRRGAGAVAGAEVVRHPSEAERVLRLLKFELSRLAGAGRTGRGREPAGRLSALLECATEALDRLDGLRRVFLKARALALAQRGLLYAADELAMAETTLQLADGGGGGGPAGAAAAAARGTAAALYTLAPSDLPRRVAELDAERASAEADVRAALGTVRYLHGLAADGGGGGGGRAPAAPAHPQRPSSQPSTLCPVCHEEGALGPDAPELAMLQCGHAVCWPCGRALVARAAPHGGSTRALACPTCRAPTAVGEVVRVVRAEPAAPASQPSSPHPLPPAAPRPPPAADGLYPGEGDLTVIGSYGTKVGAVVRRAKWLLATEGPGARMLIFSAWAGVLDVVAHALAANSIRAEQPRGPKALGDAIAAFRRGDRGRRDPSALLLLVRQGANGLNLTDAGHVFLVEPQADPAAEAQAAGRVHRIGQSRPTVVHRFVVGDTVEEGVARLAAARRAALVAGGGEGGGSGEAAAAAAAAARKKSHGEPALTVKDCVRLIGAGGGGDGAAVPPGE